MDELGGNTEDLFMLRQPHPAEADKPKTDREKTIRRNGRRALISGLGTLILAVFTTLSVAALYGAGAWGNEDGRLFATIALFTIGTLGAALLLIGAGEWLLRPFRSQLRHIQAALDEGRKERAATAQAIDVIAGHLPDALDLQNWRGFNSAVREGLGQKTGTDSHPAKVHNSRPHLVRRDTE